MLSATVKALQTLLKLSRRTQLYLQSSMVFQMWGRNKPSLLEKHLHPII
eukprot:CCRYP_011777-RB/>CCRYP_011777-RB protein AED:0.44 eAED:0.44 QI:0/-1/0/1/-1/0/1/0/48